MTLAYWFVVQCKEGDTEESILDRILARNAEPGCLNPIIGYKYWVGQHPLNQCPNKAACCNTVLIKFDNQTCKKTCEAIFNDRRVIFSCMNSYGDEKTREFLTHGNFVTAGQHLKEIAFRPWKKLNSKRKKVANEKLNHEQHVLPHPACTACTLAQEMEAVAAQLIIEKEKLHEVIKERKATELALSLLQNTIIEEKKILAATNKELSALRISALQQTCGGDRVTKFDGPCYPVSRKKSVHVPGEVGLFAIRDVKKGEVVIRMNSPVPLTNTQAQQEMKLFDTFGIRHDSVVGLGNNSVWDMDVSKNSKDGNHEEPMWYCMNHKREANANVLLSFESKDGMRYPVWKAKKFITKNQELCWEYGIVTDSFIE